MRRSFLLFGAIFLSMSLAHLMRFAMERDDIWWTPVQVAVPLAEARDRVEVYVRGDPLNRLLQAGQLRSTAPEGERVLTASDLRVRFNNRDRVIANRVGFQMTVAATAGASAVILLMGLLGWVPERRAAGTQPAP